MTHRVLHLITRLPIGGAERLMSDVVRSLDANRYQSLVCCIQDGGPIADEIAAAGFPVFKLGLMNNGGFDRRVVPALRRLIRDEGIDLIHSHLYHANFYGRIAARLERRPAIASIHNAYTRRKWHRHLINWWLGCYSEAVIAVSEEVRRDIVAYDHVPAGKVVVLQNGIDASRVESHLSREAAKVRLGYTSDEILIGCVGRLEEQKGHTFLLRAMADLRAGYPKLRLAIAGDGRKKEELVALSAALDIGGIVRFLGARDDIADVLSAFDLYVMPSLWEGLSLAMLEAMAAGRAVIISDVGGAGEVLGDNEYGIRVAPGNVGALVGAIHSVLDSPSYRQSLERKAKQRVLSHYTVRAMVKKLEGVYGQAIAGRSPPRQKKTSV